MQQLLSMGALPSTLSSERSRGTCGSADLSWKCFSTERSVVEGPAVCLDGKTAPGDDSPTTHSLCHQGKPQVPPPRFDPVGMTKFSAVTHLGMSGPGGTESSHQRVQQLRRPEDHCSAVLGSSG